MEHDRPLAVEGGWLTPVRRLPSPHCDSRPPGTVIDLLVIHGISLPPGRFGTGLVERLFTACLDTAAHPALAELAGLRVSAHLFIDRCGRLTQFVSFEERAWHAGESCFEGRSRCNDFSIGIELEGCDDLPYEAAQYATLARVAALLMRHYPSLVPGRIVGHCHIAPQRKTDPGPAFDWGHFRRLLAACPKEAAGGA